VRAGCSPFGNETSCTNAYSSFVDNSNAAIQGWVVDIASKQTEVLRYFSSSPGRMQRFAVVDVVGQTPSELNAVLEWVTCKDWNASRVTTKLVMSAAGVPPDAHHAKVREEPVIIVNSMGHVDVTSRRVERVLRSMGCPREMDDDRRYSRCANRAPRI